MWLHCEGRVDSDVDRRHPTDAGGPHHQGADDEGLAVRQAVREGDERLGGEADDDAADHRQLAQGRRLKLGQSGRCNLE